MLFQEGVFSFAMNDVTIGQAYDMLHVDLFNSIYQKSNNEKIMSPKDTDLTLFLDDKWLI